MNSNLLHRHVAEMGAELPTWVVERPTWATPASDDQCRLVAGSTYRPRASRITVRPGARGSTADRSGRSETFIVGNRGSGKSALGYSASGNKKLLSFLAELLSQFASAPDSAISTLEEASSTYVGKVRTIPYVTQVLLEEKADEAIIWTIISAPPFDDKKREPIYKAQLEVLRSLDAPLVRFELVNLRELPESCIVEQVLPKHARSLLSR